MIWLLMNNRVYAPASADISPSHNYKTHNNPPPSASIVYDSLRIHKKIDRHPPASSPASDVRRPGK